MTGPNQPATSPYPCQSPHYQQRPSLRKPKPKLPPKPCLINTSLLSGPLVEINVGSPAHTWNVHSNLLAHHSPAFANNKTLDLTDYSPDAFRIFLKYLYQGSIEDVSTLPETKKWDHTYACQHLYILCDRLQMKELQNLAIDQFRKGCYETRLVPGADEIGEIYAGTTAGCGLRKLVAKIAARQILEPDSKGAEGYGDICRKWPDFCVDVLNAMRAGIGGMLLDDPTEGNGCRYHSHDDGGSCGRSVRFEENGQTSSLRADKRSNGDSSCRNESKELPADKEVK